METNLIGKCGFYCGSCPKFNNKNCLGCRTQHKKGDCFTYDCVDNKNITYCGLCDDFPCDEIIKRKNATVLDKDWLKWMKGKNNI